MSTETPKVYQAISNVMRAMSKSGISKGRKNQQQGYAFRGIDDAMNALSPVLAENGLLVLPRVQSRTVTERATNKGGLLFYTVLDVEFDFVSAEDGSKHTIRTIGEAMDSADKSSNKAMSAAYKYACFQAFCIPTEASPDNDADFTTHEVAAATPEQVATLFAMLKGAANRGGTPEFRKVWKSNEGAARTVIVQDDAKMSELQNLCADYDAAKDNTDAAQANQQEQEQQQGA